MSCPVVVPVGLACASSQIAYVLVRRVAAAPAVDGASFKNANLAGAYFSASILDAETIENADFTDAQLPPKIQPRLCERPDAKGTNPTTGEDTRESLMCL
mmetsp:Transcript_36458/g.85220  ORF Transcript_36458/g.85220 Transcript_36458/m.85220 type:complete len:100 (-) Transcript_36458:198-497(-)